MRKDLQQHSGERKRFSATVARFGKKTNFKGYSEDTILLTNVHDVEENQKATDHIWFTFSSGFEKAGIKAGDQIEFEARVKEYKKGYVNKALGRTRKTADFKLSHPTKISVISK